MKKLLIGMLAILIIQVLLVGCSSNSKNPTPQPLPDDQTRDDVTVTPDENEDSYEGHLWPSGEYAEIAAKQIAVHGSSLLEVAPEKADQYCTALKGASQDQRLEFYVAFLSFMAKYESNFDTNQTFKEPFTDRSGEHVISSGLMQVSIESCRGYGTRLERKEELLDPTKNLECAVRILNRWMQRHSRLMSLNSWEGNVGGSKYWAVLRHGRRGYEQIKSLTKKYCKERF